MIIFLSNIGTRQPFQSPHSARPTASSTTDWMLDWWLEPPVSSFSAHSPEHWATNVNWYNQSSHSYLGIDLYYTETLRFRNITYIQTRYEMYIETFLCQNSTRWRRRASRCVKRKTNSTEIVSVDKFIAYSAFEPSVSKL